jgi:hypothetical protein
VAGGVSVGWLEGDTVGIAVSVGVGEGGGLLARGVAAPEEGPGSSSVEGLATDALWEGVTLA